MHDIKPYKKSRIRHIAALSVLSLSALAAASADHPHDGQFPGNLGQYPDLSDHIWTTYGSVDLSHDVEAVDASDLLGKLRVGFTFDTTLNKRVQAELNWFVRHPDYLDRVFTRAQRYLPYITAEIESRGLPPELALLPIVESAYDPFAYSHGRASGLWQMIPGTATRFGVRQNWWYDGRRDVVDSTNGALNYLEYLHDMMDGDWELAIASYNSGEGNVLKAVRRNKAKSLPTDFWNLKLPRETSMYVPKLLALVEIVSNPEDYGLTLPKVVDEKQFEIAEVGSQIDLALAAEMAGTELDTIYAYNSGYNRWSTDPAGPHRLLIPVEHYAPFAEALAVVPAADRVQWKRHKVKNGETISEIAEEYNTTPKALRSANDLRNNTIRAGSHLMIPVATKPLSDYGLSADARRTKKQNRQRSGTRVDYVVRSGDSFWSIGQKYGVGTRNLAAWNGMAPRDTLSVGQKLVIWTENAPVTNTTSRDGMTRKVRYTVRNGDSLYLIASRFRVTINDLVRWNNIDKNKILRPGQRLTMYVDVTAQSS